MSDDESLVALRAMRASDVDQVMAIERASYAAPWTAQTFRSLVTRPDADSITAANGDTVVGFAVAWSVADQAELGNVAVASPWRGQGIGERLVKEIVRRVAGRGVREVFLEVRVSNESARRLYRRLGFLEVGRRRDYYVRPVEDAIVMRKRLRARDADALGPLIRG